MGFARYEELIANWAVEYTRPSVEASGEPRASPSSRDRSFFNRLFGGFVEISAAWDELRLIEVLVSVAAPRSRKIDRDQYVKHLIGMYLQEVYILKERLSTYAKRTIRAYSKTSRADHVSDSIEPLLRVVDETFEGIVSIRGSHVHATRYTDEDLNRMSSMALISKYDTGYAGQSQFEYRRARAVWSKRIQENNEATRQLLDHYFDLVYMAITENGIILTPTWHPERGCADG